MVFLKNWTVIWCFIYHQAKRHFFFPKIWYLFYERKMKDSLSQKMHGNMMFSVCLVKMVFLFSTNMKLPFCQKCKDDLFPKNTLMTFPQLLKDMISVLERWYWHSIDILEKIPMNFCAFMEMFLSFFIYCFPMENPRKLDTSDWTLTLSASYIVEDIL